ncbi:MAG: fibronectin-binding autotransporter adhesin, partial [Phycisphaerales bacterium]|nr:fibronectin-binding autotransporter adhesin [Phycisphaerales bacterium]
MTITGVGGTLNLAGNNTFTGPVAINSGSVVIAAGGNLGASTNAVSLGTSNVAPSSGDPVGALSLGAGANVTVGSFTSATNNTTGINTLAIDTGAALNVNSSLAGTGINGVFVVGSPNAFTTAPITTNLTVSGAGALNVSGGAANSSFVVGIGNSPSSTATPTPTLDMRNLANFTFTTGTGPTPPPAGPGGNEFLVGVGNSEMATAYLAQNSTITAGTISVGDSNPTPGSTGNGTPVTGSNPNTLNLGSATNVLNANTIILGYGRSRGILQWATGVTTGTVQINGAAGGASTADIIVGTSSGGTPAGTASLMDVTGHAATIQAGTVIVGQMAGGTSGSSTTKGGRIDFDIGTFNAANLRLGVATSGTSGGAIVGTFNLGSSANSTGVLNVSNQFLIASNQGGAGASRGNFVIKGGTANINTNIIDNSLLTQPASVTNLTLSGGTLNMNGYAIGTTAAGTGGTRVISTITLPASGNSAALMNLGGNGINNAGLTMNGTGTLILTGTNTYTGGTIVTGGMLQVGQASDAAPLTNPLGAPAAAVTNSATLSFGSSQSVTVPNVISGAGTVAQTGSGTTTLNSANTYTGPTAVAGGILRATNIANGGVASSIGASTSAASNLLLTGGTLQYTGGGVSTNRLFSVSAVGGALDASGGGAIVFNNAGAIVSADPAARGTTTSITSTRVVLPSVLDLVVGMGVTGTNVPANTTISSINRTTNSITLSNQPTVAGPDTLSFSTTARTLTLTGSNVGGNTIAGVLADSAGGAALSLAKSGAGVWTLNGVNTYTGATSASGG